MSTLADKGEKTEESERYLKRGGSARDYKNVHVVVGATKGGLRCGVGNTESSSTMDQNIE